MANTDKTKKILRWVGYGFAIAVLVFLLVIVISLCVDKYVKKSAAPKALGCATLVIKTGSMSGTFEIGDVVIITGKKEYKIGDIITFLPEGDTIPTTHRIVRIDGDKIYTKGDNNNAEDSGYITQDQIYGEVKVVIPKLGLFVWWVRDEMGWLYLVGAVLVVVIGVYIIKNFLPNGNVEIEEAEGENKTNDEK